MALVDPAAVRSPLQLAPVKGSPRMPLVGRARRTRRYASHEAEVTERSTVRVW